MTSWSYKQKYWTLMDDDHWSFSNNSDNLPLPVAMHTKAHRLPFISCWNVGLLHNLPPNTNHITCCRIELAYQFILSSRHSPGINLRYLPFIPCPLPVLHPPWWFLNCHVASFLLSVYIHLLSSDRERHL